MKEGNQPEVCPMPYMFHYGEEVRELRVADVENLEFSGETSPEDRAAKTRILCVAVMRLAEDARSDFRSEIPSESVADAFLSGFRRTQSMELTSSFTNRSFDVSELREKIVVEHGLEHASLNDVRLLDSALYAGVSACVEWNLAFSEKNYRNLDASVKQRKRDALKKRLGWSMSELFRLRDVSGDRTTRTLFNMVSNRTIASESSSREKQGEKRTSALRSCIRSSFGSRRGFVDISVCTALAASLLCSFFLFPEKTVPPKLMEAPRMERYEPISDASFTRFSELFTKHAGERMTGTTRENFMSAMAENIGRLRPHTSERKGADAPIANERAAADDRSNVGGFEIGM